MNLVQELSHIKKTRKSTKEIMIKVTCVDGQIIEGRYGGYTQALDNEPEIASINIKKDGYSIEIMEDEMESIEEL